MSVAGPVTVVSPSRSVVVVEASNCAVVAQAQGRALVEVIFGGPRGLDGTANILIDPQAGNQLVNDANGLFVPDNEVPLDILDAIAALDAAIL